MTNTALTKGRSVPDNGNMTHEERLQRNGERFRWACGAFAAGILPGWLCYSLLRSGTDGDRVVALVLAALAAGGFAASALGWPLRRLILMVSALAGIVIYMGATYFPFCTGEDLCQAVWIVGVMFAFWVWLIGTCSALCGAMTERAVRLNWLWDLREDQQSRADIRRT